MPSKPSRTPSKPAGPSIHNPFYIPSPYHYAGGASCMGQPYIDDYYNYDSLNRPADISFNDHLASWQDSFSSRILSVPPYDGWELGVTSIIINDDPDCPDSSQSLSPVHSMIIDSINLFSQIMECRVFDIQEAKTILYHIPTTLSIPVDTNNTLTITVRKWISAELTRSHRHMYMSLSGMVDVTFPDNPQAIPFITIEK